MQDSTNPVPGGRIRRLVLGTALAAGLAVALAPHIRAVRAADLPAGHVVAQTAQAPEAAPAAPSPEASKPPVSKSAPGAASRPGAGNAATPAAGATKDKPADSGIDIEDDSDAADSAPGTKSKEREIVIEKGGKHVRIQGFGHDREYDSFEQFVQDAPWLAGLVFLVVLTVFLIPLLIIALLIWYKLRKNRLANETLLKLAERGVVTPTAAMDAVASGNPSSSPALAAAGAALSAAASASTPAYEHARFLHRRVVWSDLRKGIILTGIGLGLCAFSMFDDGTPNSVGLIFLFVGLGYCLLWFMEDRKIEPGSNTPPGTPPAGGA